jgi:hypothetical protein
VSEYDSPWKEALDVYFDQFLAFLFPPVHGGIDWLRGYESLDKELQQIVREAELGPRVVDKLVKVWRRDGEEEWVLVHVEIQSQEESDFARRMFVYNYRIFDRYNRTVVSLAVLGDRRPGWRPHHFSYGLWGCQMAFESPVVKLLDYAAALPALERDTNPFAAVVLAHLKTQETREDPFTRRDWKARIIKGLYNRGWSGTEVRQLWRFIDWMMDLPKGLENQLYEEIVQFEKEKQMPYLTTAERIGLEKGLEQGLKQGLEQGLELGLEQGLEQGRAEGQQEGLREGLLRGIEVALEIKFQAAGLQLMPEIRQMSDVAILGQIQQALRTASSLDELKRVWSEPG